jgi:pyruvate/2-oxoglutarate dehydrogenase complex dihydrolipoamide dehydrogenase (E3) component
VREAGVDVRGNTPVTPELAAELRPGGIIAALGARPGKPPIPGVDGANVMGAEYAYLHAAETGRQVLILGGGLVGIELGIFLAALGREITLVEMQPQLNDGGNMVHMNSLRLQIAEKKLRVCLSTRAKEIRADGVLAETAGEELFLPADTVIYAVGQRPLSEEALALNACAPEFYAVGDCLGAKNILAATAAAYQAALDAGRLG